MSKTHQVLGTTVEMPVHIQRARCFLAGFSASADKVAEAIAPTGLDLVTLPRGLDIPRSLNPRKLLEARTMCLLVFIEYIDGDLGPYNEFGVCFPVKSPPGVADPDAGQRATEGGVDMSNVLIHHLPVDGEFTLAAGRSIWGFPKTMADFSVEHDGSRPRGRIWGDGQLVLDLQVGHGVKAPEQSGVTFRAFSHIDDTTRMTPWSFDSFQGLRSRVGGASLTLGDHPIGQELRSFDLSKHALMTSTIKQLSMTFDDATRC